MDITRKWGTMTHRSIHVSASIEQAGDDWLTAIRGGGVKWKKTFENAVDRLTLTEGVMDERCTGCKGLQLQFIGDAYQDCLWRRHCGDGSRDLHATSVRVHSDRRTADAAHSVTTLYLSSASRAVRGNEESGIHRSNTIGGEWQNQWL